MHYNPKVVVAWMRECGIPAPVVEWPWVTGRRFRADFAWPTARLLLEVEGGIWTGGKHGRGSGIRKDMEKSSVAAAHGWRIIRVEPRFLCTDETAALVKAALAWETHKKGGEKEE